MITQESVKFSHIKHITHTFDNGMYNIPITTELSTFNIVITMEGTKPKPEFVGPQMPVANYVALLEKLQAYDNIMKGNIYAFATTMLEKDRSAVSSIRFFRDMKPNVSAMQKTFDVITQKTKSLAQPGSSFERIQNGILKSVRRIQGQVNAGIGSKDINAVFPTFISTRTFAKQLLLDLKKWESPVFAFAKNLPNNKEREELKAEIKKFKDLITALSKQLGIVR